MHTPCAVVVETMVVRRAFDRSLRLSIRGTPPRRHGECTATFCRAMQRSEVGGGAARECGAHRAGEGLVAPPHSILSADAGLSGAFARINIAARGVDRCATWMSRPWSIESWPNGGTPPRTHFRGQACRSTTDTVSSVAWRRPSYPRRS